MTHLHGPETGYTSAPEARQSAWHSLCLAAHGIMWGRVDEYPFWDPEEKVQKNPWEGSTRVKYLALPYYEAAGGTKDLSGYLPVELRLLEQGGTHGGMYYRLRSADLEIVWSDQAVDVLLCEVQGTEIIDGLDGGEIQALATLLDYETCITYDPRHSYIDDGGALIQPNPSSEINPPSIA